MSSIRWVATEKLAAVAKVGGVAAGYVAALLAAIAVVWIRLLLTSAADGQSSSGMQAFGDALLFVAVFGVAALVPTGAALFLLRPYRRFWSVMAASGLAVAATGLAAAVLFAVDRNASPSALRAWADLSVLRILAAPLVTLMSLLCAVVSPYRFARLAFLAAAATDVAVSAYGVVVWIVPLVFSTP